jgi:GxxExxY protein
LIDDTTKNAEPAERAELRNFTLPELHRSGAVWFLTASGCHTHCKASGMSEKDRLNALTGRIIDAAITVHHELGPGMLESAYEACLAYELMDRGLAFDRQKPLPLTYRGHILDCGYRIDLLVENAVVVEVKSIARFDRVHGGQLVSYLRQTGCKVGLAINFNVKRLVSDGIMRKVNGFPE